MVTMVTKQKIFDQLYFTFYETFKDEPIPHKNVSFIRQGRYKIPGGRPDPPWYPMLYTETLGIRRVEEETFYYRASTFAESTNATYKSHRDSYLRFFTFVGYSPIQASTFVISQYASFLARSFIFYLGVASLLHKEFS